MTLKSARRGIAEEKSQRDSGSCGLCNRRNLINVTEIHVTEIHGNPNCWHRPSNSLNSRHERYIELLGHYARRFGLNIAGYCLMTNHIHVVANPQQEDSIARTFQHCHGLYAVEFNRKYIKSGHLLQGRPYSCVLDTAHSWAALRYVERNPVRAGMVARAEQYAWSSARAHCGESSDGLLTSDWPNKNAPADWSSWLVGTDEDQEQGIRPRSFTGRPCGDEQFTRYAESGDQTLVDAGKTGAQTPW